MTKVLWGTKFSRYNHGLVLLFEPRDLWWGVYWDRGGSPTFTRGHFIAKHFLTIYLCYIPCFPLRLLLWLPYKTPKKDREIYLRWRET